VAKILIVDDDTVNARLYANNLKTEGHEIALCLNGQEALDKIGERFDLILLDIMMPRMDGISVLKEIKRGVNKNTPVLVYTNLISEEVKKEALENGAEEFLLKADFTPLQLLEKVQGYLAKK